MQFAAPAESSYEPFHLKERIGDMTNHDDVSEA